MKTKTYTCQAANPATCRYHGVALTTLEFQLRRAEKQGDTNSYLKIQTEIKELLDKEDKDLTIEKIFNTPNVLPESTKKSFTQKLRKTFGLTDRPEMLQGADLFQVSTTMYASTRSGLEKQTQELRVAAENELPVRCLKCSEPYSKETFNALMKSTSTTCGNCSTQISWGAQGGPPYIVDVDYSQRTLLGPKSKQPYAQKWYHLGSSAQWDEDAKKNKVYVHIGTAEAALARLADQSLYSSKTDETFYLYEIELNQDAKLNPTIFGDGNRWPDSVDEEGTYTDIKPNQINRYINQWEAPGTVSIISSPHLFTVKNVQKISM